MDESTHSSIPLGIWKQAQQLLDGRARSWVDAEGDKHIGVRLKENGQSVTMGMGRTWKTALQNASCTYGTLAGLSVLSRFLDGCEKEER